jgi:hypothetical protein
MLYFRCLPGVAMIAAATLAGCKSDRASSSAATFTTAASGSINRIPLRVNISATDFAFQAPAKIPAGAVTMHLVNRGKELHHAQVVKLDQGKTIDDLAKALKNPGPPPSWVKFVGGPNAVVPGKETDATSVLAPGRYAYLCFIFGPDGVIHAAKGMVHPFEVTEAPSGGIAQLPKPDVTIKMLDYDYQPSRLLTPGRRTITVENDGPQPHELALLKLAPGKRVEDFAAWAEGGMKGPPPAEPIGGVAFLDKGARGSFTAELTPGDYGLMCFVPDAKDGKPHLAHGMMKTIKVG